MPRTECKTAISVRISLFIYAQTTEGSKVPMTDPSAYHIIFPDKFK